MSIGKRLARLIKADIHGILDCLEDPRSILQQAMRDMEEEIAKTEEELRRREDEAKQLTQARDQVEQGYQEANRQLEICFSSNNDALARTFVRKRLELEKRIKAVIQLLDENSRRRDGIAAELKDRREKLVSIREKAELFAARDCSKPASPDEHWHVSDEQVELAMIEEKNKRASGASRAA